MTVTINFDRINEEYDALARELTKLNKISILAAIKKHEKLLKEILADPHKIYFVTLLKTEPEIDWMDFADKVYSQSDSTSSVTTYSTGIYQLRNMLAIEKFAKDADDTMLNLVHDVVMAIRTDEKAGPKSILVYKLLDRFARWCHSKGWKGRTQRSFVMGVKRLFVHIDIDIDDNKFKDKVTLSKISVLRDEYPENEEIRKVMAMASPLVRTMIQTLCDYGFEPIDIAQLKPKYIHWDESPVRGNMDREKTNEPLEFFFGDETAEALKVFIKNSGKGPDDYIFTGSFTKSTVNTLRGMYNTAFARAGFGKLVKTKTGYYGVVDKIDGHNFGKYHMKVFKKRWFSIAIASGVPAYIVHGMLGRKEYLDEYNRQPLHKKQEFARKILRNVSIYSSAKKQQEALEEAGEILGIGKLTPEQAKALKETLSFFMRMPPNKRKELFKVTGQEDEESHE